MLALVHLDDILTGVASSETTRQVTLKEAAAAAAVAAAAVDAAAVVADGSIIEGVKSTSSFGVTQRR